MQILIDHPLPLSFIFLQVTSGTEDLMSPRPTLLMKTPASVFARSIVGGPQSPLTAPFTPDLDSPFASPALRRLTAPVEQCSPWHGTVQSPHIMRRAPKLWSTSTGERRLMEDRSLRSNKHCRIQFELNRAVKILIGAATADTVVMPHDLTCSCWITINGNKYYMCVYMGIVDVDTRGFSVDKSDKFHLVLL